VTGWSDDFAGAGELIHEVSASVGAKLGWSAMSGVEMPMKRYSMHLHVSKVSFVLLRESW
jgi:hypothetical protein